MHLNSFLGNSLIRTSFTLGGPAHFGGEPLSPLFFNQSENQAKWQLHMKGFCIKFLKFLKVGKHVEKDGSDFSAGSDKPKDCCRGKGKRLPSPVV